MSVGAFAANGLWLAAGWRASRRFHTALTTPRETQDALLQRLLARDAASQFGQRHDFHSLRAYADFARAVPLSTYADMVPDVARIRRGELHVLGAEPVTHLVPTSGSSDARKLIPFTASLAHGFDVAVAPWMHDLARLRPRILGGPAYWSISPLHADNSAYNAGGSDRNDSVPIGFADDADYLGGTKAWLVRQVLAVPAVVRHVRTESDFWALSLLALLRRGDLRLISVWHPSFLEILVQHAEPFWEELLSAVHSGENPWAHALPAGTDEWRTAGDQDRASMLRSIGPGDWPRWWPELQVVSCWGEQAAEPGWRRLVRRLPGVLVQAKGLLATEGVVTVPIAGRLPLAVTSHVYEFIDATTREVLRPHELRPGGHYEVVLTNGAGLWRYQLRDLVECTGRLAETPTLRFLGRVDQVSDLRGEKLSEPFVAECLRTLWPHDERPAVAVLRAIDDEHHGHYELLVSDDGPERAGVALPALGVRLDEALGANPHYALARRLGQLAPIRVTLVGTDFLSDTLKDDLRPGRIGDRKPPTLIRA